jgi:CMP-N,N'-diacetyllegionaminic acid synthase
MSDVIAIIPVRAGSKGVANKNMRLAAGRPLLWYAVSAARAARVIHRTFVSTEDAELAAYAQSLGADVILHPADLSGEDSPTYPVIAWDLQHLHGQGVAPSVVAVLRATSPLRTSADINESVSLLQRSPNADSVVSVTEAVGVHPIRLKRILDDGRIVDAFEPEGTFPRRRQELERLFLRNGAVYAARSTVIEAGGLWGSHCLPYVMPEERSLNINTECQLLVADLLLRHQEHPR